MALSGELSDLSLAELIEFFCNQRKTGCLKITYAHGAGYFYLQAGSVVHARIGSLHGIDAVYSALTLSNASFTFSPLVEAPERTINQPWTQVVLEGLRRMDEGVVPEEAFSPDYRAEPNDPGAAKETSDRSADQPAFLSGFGGDSGSNRSRLVTAGVVAVIVLVVAVAGVPAGWYSRNKPAPMAGQPQSVATPQDSNPVANAPVDSTPAPAENSADSGAQNDDATLLAARREREARDRAKAREEKAGPPPTAVLPMSPAVNADSAKKQANATPVQKKVTVQVSYDESGRVTQASGGDATALRVARQKRFPSGKAGSATVTIPIN